MWRVYLLSGLIACLAGGVAGFLTANLAGSGVQVNSAAVSSQTVTLEGEERIDKSNPDNPREKVVHYKTPFASPPYVTTTPPHFTISDQKAESFKLQLNPGMTPGTYGVHWKAEGVPAKQ